MTENSSDELVPIDDELCTVVLVDDEDTVVGSVAPDELYTSSDKSVKATHLLHRTASLYIVARDEDRLLVSTTTRLGGNHTVVSATISTTPYFGMTPPEVLQPSSSTTPSPPQSATDKSSEMEERNSRMSCKASPTPADVQGARNALFRAWKEAYGREKENEDRTLPPPPDATTAVSSAEAKSESMQFLGRIQHCEQIEYVFLFVSDVLSTDAPLWESSPPPFTTPYSVVAASKRWMTWKQLQLLVQSLPEEVPEITTSSLVSPDAPFGTVVSWFNDMAKTERSSQSSPWNSLWNGSGSGALRLLPNAYQILEVPCPPTERPAATQQPLHDTSKKQGAYGKIITHKESKLSQLMRLDEVWAALSYLYISPLPSNLVIDDPDVAFCEEILVAVSRSFAAVIRQLPPVMLKDVAIFYLVLRALDTVEDDMTAFPNNAFKIQHLLKFHTTALGDPNWRMHGVGQGDERRLLQEFPAVHRVFASLEPHSQEVIRDITFRMATGMAEFIGKDLGQGTVDVSEYNRYCHFVAGLVGEGLSRLFSLSTLEDESLAKDFHLSDQMGLFLQKTNIIRDFLEDYVDQRAFWPQTIWKKYSATGDLGYFCDVETDPVVKRAALQCLNELVADALELVPDCLAYMSSLQCAEVFRFCAIPQVMAVATLEKCYNNPQVFTGVVKIRKGLSCQLIQRSSSVAELHETFYSFVENIQRRCQKETVAGDNPVVYARTLQACTVALDLTRARAMDQRRARRMRRISVLATLGAIALVLGLLWFGAIPFSIMATDDHWFVVVLRAVLVVVAFSWFGRFLGPWTTVRSKSTLKPADLLMSRTVV